MVQNGNPVLRPVFIHSSFRTGSTWLWSKFRENTDCYCYYEVYNEILSSINYKSILQSPSTWNSHHPSGAPYFLEFSPLLQKGSGGVKGFDDNMPLSDFFLEPGDDPNRITYEKSYLKSLIELAESKGKIPVLSCTRSIGRVKFIKSAVGGVHILIKRRLLNQWFSYSNQAANNNSFFLNTVIQTVHSQFGDEFISTLREFSVCNELDKNTIFHNQDELLVLFLSLHIYLYIKYHSYFDIVIDLEKGPSKDNLEFAARAIFDITSVSVDLSDYKEVISAPYKLIEDVDRVVILVRSLFAQGLPGVDDGKLQAFVDNELGDFQKEYAQYCRIAGSAHVQLEKSGTAQLQAEAQRDDANAKLAAIHETENSQIIDLGARLEAASGEVASLTQRLHSIESSAQHERARGQSLNNQLAEAIENIQGLTQDLEQSRSNESCLGRQLKESELARTSGEDAERALQVRCSRLEHEVQQAVSNSIDARARHEAQATELAAMAQRVDAMTTTIQQERAKVQSLNYQLVQATEQKQRLENKLERTIAKCHDLDRRLESQDLARASAEKAMRAAQEQCANLNRDLQDARAEAERSLAALEWVSSGGAEKSEAFARRWSAMMDRIK